MLNFYRTKLLILEKYISVYDIYIIGISPVLGKIHLIAKNAASSKSKRKVQLKKGNLLNTVIFHKNRYYLSDISVETSFFTKLNTLNQVKALNAFLQIIEGFYLYPDFDEFNKILELLNHTFLLHKYSIPTASVLLLYIFRVLPNGVKCQKCENNKVSGYLTEIGWVCNKCILNNHFSSRSLKLDFSNDDLSVSSLNKIINTMLK